MTRSPTDFAVSVIIPTMASLERSQLLQRAVASIRASSSQAVRIIAVVNGTRFDTQVCDWLKAQSDIHFEYMAEPSLPGALLRGRELVETDYFSTLDDDDEYLPGVTDQKLAALHADAQADLLVGNFYRCSADGVDTLGYDRLGDVPARPLECGMQFNWLSSGNALYRTASVPVRYFEISHAYAEWTLLAFQLAMDAKKIIVLDIPVFRCHETPNSLSKSTFYVDAYIPLFERMLAAAPPPAIARLVRQKMGAAYHDASVAALREGKRFHAWRYHGQSLAKPGGLRYLSYTRFFFK